MSRPIGGHKQRAWRLKKKSKKWFNHVLQELIKSTLVDMPPAYFERMWDDCNYPIYGIYK